MAELLMILAVMANEPLLKEEAWGCSSTPSGTQSVVASYEPIIDEETGKEKSFKAGRVDIGSTQQPGVFEIRGLDRVWRFGFHPKVDNWAYSFIIGPDGIGRYFDFTNATEGEAVQVKYTLYCEKLPTKAG